MEFLILLVFYLIVGLPLYCIYYNIFNDSRLLFASTFSIMLGFIFYNLYQLIFGHFGCSLTGNMDTVYKGSFLILSWGLLFFNKSYEPLKRIYKVDLKWNHVNKLNVFLSSLLLLFYLYALKKINVTFFIPWDVFHYWLLDPKIIFETGFLRQGIDLIDIHKYYGSFLSVSISDLYELMGEVKERRAAYFTLLHAFFAAILLWQGISKNETSTKLFGFSILFIVLSSFSSCKWFYTSYTEVHCAFYILLFVYLLLSLKEFQIKDYGLRLLLLASVLYILVDIKPYYPQVIFLCMLWFAYDFLNFRDNIFKKINIKLLIPFCLIFLLVFFSYKYYVSNFISEFADFSNKPRVKSLENTPHLLHIVLQELLPSSLKEGQEIYNTFDARIDRFMTRFTLLSLSAMSILFLKMDDFRIKYVITALLGISSIYLLYVVFIFPDAPRDSFYRYGTLFFFLIPLVFTYKFSFVNKVQSKILSIIFLSLALLSFLFASFQPSVLKKKNHEGSFNEFPKYKMYADVATKSLTMINPDDKVMVVNAGRHKKRVLCTRSTRIVRYNLINNIVGGLNYQTDKLLEFRDILQRHDVDFLIVENPDKNEIITKLIGSNINSKIKDSFYLIKINNLQNKDFTVIEI